MIITLGIVTTEGKKDNNNKKTNFCSSILELQATKGQTNNGRTYRVCQKSSLIKDSAKFSVWHKILHTIYPFTCSQIWKVSLHYLQNWQNYTDFSYGSL